MNQKINFMIIGAQKAGSSSLHAYLSQHPDIFMPTLKDIQYFERDEYYVQLDEILNEIYKDLQNEKVVGGSDVNLLYFYEVAERIYNYNPKIKLIAILRNPIDRAYSAYWAAVRDGFESAKTFEEAISLEEKRRKGTLRERGILTYLEHGHYDIQLQHYYDVFGNENIRVFLLEDLIKDAQYVIRNILTWLGLPEDISMIDFSKRENASAISKLPGLQRILMTEGLHTMAYRKLPPKMRVYIYDKFYMKFRNLTAKPFKYPPMSAETREKLIEYYRPHVEKLSILINRNLEHWLRYPD